MGIIQVEGLTFRYDNDIENIFENIYLKIDTNWKLGLIGRNGKGKTTFLKLLLDEYEYSGNIIKSVNCEYFPFKVEDEKQITIDIIKKIVPQIEEWKIKKELNLISANLDILERPFFQLSGGEKVKVLLISLFLKENVFLLIDEPTNHLDNSTKIEVEKYLKLKNGFIIVSHDRMLLNNVVDHILSINNTGIDIQKGNYSSWKENKDREDKFEINKNDRLKSEIKKLDEAVKRTADWSDKIERTRYVNENTEMRIDRGYIGHQSARLMQRSKAIERRKNIEIEEKKSLLKNIDKSENLEMKPCKFKKSRLIEAKGLQINYGDKIVFDKLNFEVNVGDRIALIGKNGSGKTTLINCILGNKVDYQGRISVTSGMKISYVSQETNDLKGTLSEYAKKNNIDESIFKAMLCKLGVDKLEFYKDISNMSDGQKKKILIAKSISESADLYIWDEPLNYIDIISREQIEEMLLKYKPTIIFVEHDEMFRKKIANKSIKL